MQKIFNNEEVRTVWDSEAEKYYISVVDIVSIISESKDGRKYWNKLKQRLREEGNESVTNCHQLKLKAQVAKNTRDDIENLLGESIVTNKNKLNYKYADNKQLKDK